MGTLIYSPSVTIRIADEKGVIWDVSADIADFAVDRELGISSANFTLINADRKYDGVFKAMDRVVIYQRRFTTLLTFSGYLDQAPVFSTYAESVVLRASCSAKRLQHFHWDPAASASVELMTPVGSDQITDGGVAEQAIKLLNTVMQWPRAQIHIAAIPHNWLDKVAAVADELSKQAEVATQVSLLGSASYLWGNNPKTGSRQVIAGLPDQGRGTGVLPDTIGKCSQFGGPSGGAYGNMALTGEPGGLRDDQRAKYGGPYYCAMRWPYIVYNKQTWDLEQPHYVTSIAKCVAWWRNRKILVVAQKTHRACVVRAADWGPGSGGNANLKSADARIIDLSETTLKALGIKTDDVVAVAFADDNAKLGPVDVTTGNAINADASLKEGITQTALAAGDPIVLSTGWKRDGSDITTIKVKGFSVQVAKQAAPRFTGFINELVDVLHYQPKVIGGYRAGSTIKNPSGQETGKADNHSYGAAIDIDWYEYGNGFYNTPGDYSVKHKIPDTCRELAHKWGLWWGGDYHSIKDYMHFEVVGAPATPHEATTTLQGGYVPSSSYQGDTTGSTAGAATDQFSFGTSLINAYDRIGSTDFSGELLTGARVLMNDVPIYGAFDDLMSMSLRHWCTAPNGDIIGWFPDYFGHYGTASKMIIQDIEIEKPFTVAHSDDRLKTHMFVTSASSGFEGLGDATQVWQAMDTAGIASVEWPELMSALFNLPKADFADKGKKFLTRYGARPDNHPMDNITGHKQEFYFACFRFMQNWSDQWSCQVSLTYMPEIYPGMLLVFPKYGVQAYVQSVRHSGTPGADGGGFRTDVTLTAWSTLGKKTVIPGLPVGAPL